MTTVANLLAQQQQLAAISDSAALDTELLLCHCLQKDRSYLRAWPEASVSEPINQQFQQLFNRRLTGEPVAYLLGRQGFWTLDLAVSPVTLIPRPETELLVEKTLQLLSGKPQTTVLDLGTGTGAIALALASEHPKWHVTACDVQPEAVVLAQKNQQTLALKNVSIIQSDWFEQLNQKQFDCIVSNPPYIDPDDQHLTQGDVRFEPRSALVAGKQGMADIEYIISTSRRHLKPEGWLLMEHGYQQAEWVTQALNSAGFSHVFTETDLAGLARVTGGRYVLESE